MIIKGQLGNFKRFGFLICSPEGPSTQYLRFLVPNTMKGMVSGTRNLKYWVLGLLGSLVNKLELLIPWRLEKSGRGFRGLGGLHELRYHDLKTWNLCKYQNGT